MESCYSARARTAHECRATPPRATRAAEGLPRWRFTATDVEAMVAGILDEDERVELIEGELDPLSAKGRRRELVKVVLMRKRLKARPEFDRLKLV
jgi:hypothetical protein